MNERTKSVCDRLEGVIKLAKQFDYEKFPIDFLMEITEEARKMYDPTDEELVSNIKKNETNKYA